MVIVDVSVTGIVTVTEAEVLVVYVIGHVVVVSVIVLVVYLVVGGGAGVVETGHVVT